MFGVFGSVLLVFFCAVAELSLYAYGGVLLALLPMWLGLFVIVVVTVSVRRRRGLRLVVDNAEDPDAAS